MRFQVIDDAAALPEIAADWRRLHHAAGGLPFQNPDLHLLWWRTLGSVGWRPHVVVGHRDGQVALVCPLAVRRKGPVRLLRWAGEDVFDHGDVIAAPGTDPGGLWRFVRASGRHDVALLRNIHPDAACRPGLAAAARPGPRREAAAFVALGWPTGEAWLASLKSDHRTKYRSRLRKLEACGPVAFHRDRPGEDVAPVLAALIAHKRQWSRGRGQPSVFDSDQGAQFFREFPATLGRQTHLSWLTCGGDIVACHLGYVAGRTLGYYMPAYDDKWSAMSPGTILLFHILMWAVDAGLAELDFLRGQEPYKQQVATGARPLVEYLFASSLLGAGAQMAWRRRKQAGVEPPPAA